MKLIASDKNLRCAHILASDYPNAQLLCGAAINPRNWYYVEKSEIRDFAETGERREYSLCVHCKNKLAKGNER